jgi:phage terminase small subunit
MELPKLTAKQKLFCKEYIKDLNAGRAAIAAGYSKKHPML